MQTVLKNGMVVSWIDGFCLYLTSPTVDLILSLISSTLASYSLASLDLCLDILSCEKRGFSKSVTILTSYLFDTIWQTDFVIMLLRWCVGALYSLVWKRISFGPNTVKSKGVFPHHLAPHPPPQFLLCNASMAAVEQCKKPKPYGGFPSSTSSLPYWESQGWSYASFVRHMFSGIYHVYVPKSTLFSQINYFTQSL